MREAQNYWTSLSDMEAGRGTVMTMEGNHHCVNKVLVVESKGLSLCLPSF